MLWKYLQQEGMQCVPLKTDCACSSHISKDCHSTCIQARVGLSEICRMCSIRGNHDWKDNPLTTATWFQWGLLQVSMGGKHGIQHVDFINYASLLGGYWIFVIRATPGTETWCFLHCLPGTHQGKNFKPAQIGQFPMHFAHPAWTLTNFVAPVMHRSCPGWKFDFAPFTGVMQKYAPPTSGIRPKNGAKNTGKKHRASTRYRCKPPRKCVCGAIWK